MVLEPAEIQYEIKMLMKKFMQDICLMVALGKDQDKNRTDIALWKQQHQEYWNWRTDEMVGVYKCQNIYYCKCQAKARIITGKNYKRLELYGTLMSIAMLSTIPKS